MIFVLLLVFFVLFLIEYKIQKSFVSPLSILLASFLMALGLTAENFRNWDVKINSTFILYIFVAILSFAAGSFLVEISFNKKLKKYSLTDVKPSVSVGLIKVTSILFLILDLVCAVAYILITLRQVDYHGSIGGLIKAIYDYKINSGTSNFVVHQMIEIVVAVSKISLFEGFLLLYFHKGKNKIFTLSLIGIQVIVFFACGIISTDRNIVLRFFIYALVLWILFETSKDSEKKKEKVDLNIAIKTIAFVLIVSLLFFIQGRARNVVYDFGKMIGIYGGSGLYNFNLFVLKDREYMLGQSTFRTVIDILKSFGLVEGTASETAIFDEAIAYRSSGGYYYSSNIYSSLRAFWEDFGVSGVIILSAIMGVIFEMFYIFAKKRKYGFTWIFYALMIYSVVYFVIDEQFYRRLHLGMVYEIGWVAFFYLVVKFFEKIGIGEGKRSSAIKGIANEL